jgi:hypothetical protein
MNRAVMVRSLLIGALGAALIGLFVWWWMRTYEWVVESIDLPPRGEAAYNPLYALKRALEIDGRKVDARQRLDPFGNPLRPQDTVLMLGDPRALTAREVDALLEWVGRGGHLIVRTPPIGAELAGEDVPLLDDLGIVAMDADPLCHGLQVGKHEHHIEFCYGRRFYFDERRRIATAAIWGDEELNEYGYARILRDEGTVDVIADLDFLDNDNLEDPQHAALARQLLQPNWSAGGTFHLIYSAEMPSLLGLLIDHAWRALLPAALALLLWLWMRAERFGPLRSAPPPDRRSLLEHIQASGDHLNRYGRRATLYAAAHEAFMRRLRQRDPYAAALEGPAQIDALVKRTGWTAAEVEAALRYPRAGDVRDFVLRIAKLLQLRTRL